MLSRIEHILSASAGIRVSVAVDWWMINDGAGYNIPSLVGGKEPADVKKVKVFLDHNTPCGNEILAAQQSRLIEFATRHGCDLHNGYGISYQLMLDKYVRRGQIIAFCGEFPCIFGANGAFGMPLSPEELAASMISGRVELSVPKTVAVHVKGRLRPPCNAKDLALTVIDRVRGMGKGKSVEFFFRDEQLQLSERIALLQLMSETGAISAFITSTLVGEADLEIDCADVEPMLAGPCGCQNIVKASSLREQHISSVFIGGCSQGRIEDIRIAAKIAAGKRVHRMTRCMASFVSADVYIQACNEGLVTTLLEAGVLVMNPGCSACNATSTGLVDAMDVVLSAGSRVCPNGDRLGNAATYLCSAATAMTSAIAGVVATGG